MSQDNEQARREESEIGVLIAKTAIKTVVYALVGIVLVAALFTTFFPYGAMRLYGDLGNKSRALECAERFLNGERQKYEGIYPALDSKYVLALHNACSLSISLYGGARNDDERKERAEQVKKYTDEYLAVPSIAERNRLIDEYNIKRGGQPYYYHPSLYSYRDYLVRYNYLARIELGERNKWIYAGEQSDTAIFSNMFVNLEFAPTNNNIDEICEALNMLSAMIDYDFKRASVESFGSLSENELGSIPAIADTVLTGWFEPLAAREGKTQLLRNIESKFELLKNYAVSMTVTDSESALHGLYVFRSLSNFADSASAFLTALASSRYYDGITTNDDVWRGNLGHINIEGNNYNMRDYYNNVLLPRYAGMLV